MALRDRRGGGRSARLRPKKRARNYRRPLRSEEIARNRAIGRVRAQVERTFAVLKQWYGYRRVRYRSLLRNGLQLQLLCIAMNLRRALVLTA